MAHNLATDKKTGRTAFASGNGQKAWHNLGQIVDNSMTSAEAIKLACLDYNVVQVPLTIEVPNQKFGIVVPNKFATLRDDTNDIFGVVGNRYQIIQNVDAFDFFDNIVGKGAAIFETAGALGVGEKIFITAKMPKDLIRIAGTDDVTEMYVLLTSTHDGSGSIIAAITPIRVVCQNTLNAALKDCQNKVLIRHTSSAIEKLQNAELLLGITHKLTEDLNEVFNVLAKKPVTDAKVKLLVEDIFKGSKNDKGEFKTRIANIHNQVLESYFNGVGQNKIIGTAWGVYNGITHYLDHVKQYKDNATMLESLSGGESFDMAQLALTKLIEL